MQRAFKNLSMEHALKARMAQVGKAVPTQQAPESFHIERVIRCRKCFRSGMATWEATSTGALALLALSEGFHRRARVPLSLPPEIVCNCGAAQPDHDCSGPWSGRPVRNAED